MPQVRPTSPGPRATVYITSRIASHTQSSHLLAHRMDGASHVVASASHVARTIAAIHVLCPPTHNLSYDIIMAPDPPVWSRDAVRMLVLRSVLAVSLAVSVRANRSPAAAAPAFSFAHFIYLYHHPHLSAA